MTSPRRFSIMSDTGDTRGFLFFVSLVSLTVFFPIISAAQPSKGIWLLVFGGDTLTIQREVPNGNVMEASFEEAWRHGYFGSELIQSHIRGDTLVAIFMGRDRYLWAEQPVVWSTDSLSGFRPVDCALSSVGYLASDVESCMEQQARLLAKNGYLSAEIALDTLVVDHRMRTVSAYMSIKKGDLAYLNEVTWNGLDKTGTAWLEKAARVKKGSVLEEDEILQLTNRLRNIALFEEVPYPEVYLNGTSWGLLYTVKERPLAFVDIVLGYVPDARGRASIVGTGSLHIRNAGFDGTDLMMDYDRQAAGVGSIDLSLEHRYLMGYPVGVLGTFAIGRQDSLWQSRNLSLGAWWEPHENVRVLASVYRKVSTAATLAQDVADLWGNYLRLSMELNTRNSNELASAGISASLVAESGRQIVEPVLGERFNQDRRQLSADVELSIPFSGRNRIVPGVTGGTILSERAYVNDLWRIGGAKSLRGYREDQFFALSFGWGTIEYQFLLDPHSYLFAFGTAGWLWIPTESSTKDASDRLRVGAVGFGMAYRTNIGVLKFTYAKSNEDPFSNAKVHVGISSGF